MTTLILDTSTDLCVIALSQEGKIIAESICSHQNRLSKILLPSIKSLLDELGLLPTQLKKIALGIGPGSYTGTRVGASVAKTLSFALNIPLIPFLSPYAFIPPCRGKFAFIIATKPGPYFVLKGCLEEEMLKQESSGLIPLTELETSLESTPLLIFSASDPVPPLITPKKHLHAALNLPQLASLLPSIPSSLPEDVTIEYLHTPHLLLKNIAPIP